MIWINHYLGRRNIKFQEVFSYPLHTELQSTKVVCAIENVASEDDGITKAL
jgi:hypothetical protein